MEVDFLCSPVFFYPPVSAGKTDFPRFALFLFTFRLYNEISIFADYSQRASASGTADPSFFKSVRGERKYGQDQDFDCR